MNRIIVKTVDEYKRIVSENKEKQKKLINNAYYMTNVIKQYVNNDQLSFLQYDDGLWFFIDEGNYYNSFYIWNSDRPFPSNIRNLINKPVLVEILVGLNQKEKAIMDLDRKLIECGFILQRINGQFEQNLTNENYHVILEQLSHIPLPEGLFYTKCQNEKQFLESAALWDQELDPTDIPASHKKPFSNEILCVCNGNNKVVATEWVENSGSNSEGRHTVVDPDYRGHNLAYYLLLVWCKEAFEKSKKKCFTWISNQNHRSIHIHNKAGFTANGKKSRQYIHY